MNNKIATFYMDSKWKSTKCHGNTKVGYYKFTTHRSSFHVFL